MNETPAKPKTKPKALKDLALLAAVVLSMRIPFVNQAVGGDDVYYLAAAYHGLIDPLHPNHNWYVFEGKDVTFQGYPHPPGNAWFLAGLIGLGKDVHEVPFHIAYIRFSLIAVLSMYALARRFSNSAVWTALLFAVVPAFFINGNTFEADIPFLAFWTAGAAAFVYAVDRTSAWLLALSAVCLAASALIAMQAFLFTPILLAYLWSRRGWTRRGRRNWAQIGVAFTPVVTLIAWQIFERITSGQFPIAVSAGYVTGYGYTRLAMKLRNALSLTIHACFMVFPILLPFAARAAWRRRKEPDTRFLLLWIGMFLGGAWILFFAGSARYLLPMAAPLVILASRAPARWVRAAFVIQCVISMGLATVNYQHWNAYRTFAAALHPQMQGKRVWVDAEWGLRHYLEADGALPLHQNQWIPAGDLVVESQLAFPAPILHGGRALVPIAQMTIDPTLPFRLIGLESNSAYSTSEGFLPYDFRGGVIDRLTAYVLRTQEPTVSQLPMNAPETDGQIVYGIYPAEGNPWRWMAGEGSVLLKSPRRKAALEVKLYIAPTAPARAVRISVLNGPEVTKTFPGPGAYTVTMPVDTANLSPVTVKIAADRTFQPPGDNRQLGIILNSVGLQ